MPIWMFETILYCKFHLYMPSQTLFKDIFFGKNCTKDICFVSTYGGLAITKEWAPFLKHTIKVKNMKYYKQNN